jgi:hypothetical protein
MVGVIPGAQRKVSFKFLILQMADETVLLGRVGRRGRHEHQFAVNEYEFGILVFVVQIIDGSGRHRRRGFHKCRRGLGAHGQSVRLTTHGEWAIGIAVVVFYSIVGSVRACTSSISLCSRRRLLLLPG